MSRLERFLPSVVGARALPVLSAYSSTRVVLHAAFATDMFHALEFRVDDDEGARSATATFSHSCVDDL